MKRKYKFLYSIMSSKNVLCVIRREFAQNEPQEYACENVNNN